MLARIIGLLCLVALTIALAFSITITDVEQARRASIQILPPDFHCSATAIAPYAILTAAHCDSPDDELLIRGRAKPIHIAARIKDNADHIIYLFDGDPFKEYVYIDMHDSLKSAEHVFTWGNPGDWLDIFQEGSIKGTIQVHRFDSTVSVVIFSFEGYGGQSGSGIFRNGKLVAVLSTIEMQHDFYHDYTIYAPGAFPFTFTKADLSRAYSYNRRTPWQTLKKLSWRLLHWKNNSAKTP